MVSREQWKEPDMILKSSFALTKLSHVFAGIVFWQFVSNLDFDYSMLTGKRRQRWTFWVYLSSRLACIGIVISSLIMINSRRPVNCQALIISLETLQAVAYALSLLLAMLRVVAIWDRLLPVIALCAIAWLTSVAFWIRIVAMVHLSPIPPFSSVAGASMCFITSSPPFLPLSIVTLFIYFVLLAGMIGGLARKPHLGSVGIWKLLYRQGLAWLALATIAELPTLVLLCINLNDVMNFILQVPRGA
ncbi:hypothetical protein FA95DRAFT_714509 [Auriscalpium vulgare]|uniref:Uncharacterized protein n=1 Tax=Auriscalpium vulgare TaxID=40419 RepID=A0ACB8RCD0_9AGAM|nr:hypothetical protein FA95DRAFT_714509 [Auriscalpium vulgare]